MYWFRILACIIVVRTNVGSERGSKHFSSAKHFIFFPSTFFSRKSRWQLITVCFVHKQYGIIIIEFRRNITSTENITVAVLAFGEGWHNYHHTFPWDYKAAELGNYRYNFSTAFIDVCARLGLAYNLKTVNASLMEKRIRRTGNGTKTHSEIWGWGDNDMMDDDKRIAHVLNWISIHKNV